MALRSQRLRLAPSAPDTEGGTPPEVGALVLAPLTEHEYPVARWALEEVSTAIRDFKGSDTAALDEFFVLRDALAVALADRQRHSERGLRWRWRRLRRRRHTLGAVLFRYGVEPEAS